jgi:hypothetical protein
MWRRIVRMDEALGVNDVQGAFDGHNNKSGCYKVERPFPIKFERAVRIGLRGVKPLGFFYFSHSPFNFRIAT